MSALARPLGVDQPGPGGSAGLRNGLRALLWLERRQLLNRLRTLLTHPARMLAWLLFLAYLLVAVQFRTVTPRGLRLLPTPYAFADFLGAVLPGIALVLIGAVVLIACVRPPAVFASPADGRFLCSSGVPPRLVVTWLQVRQLAGYGLRALLPLSVYVTAVPAVFRLSTASTLVLLASALLIVALTLNLRLPVYMYERGRPGVSMELVGAGLVVLGLAAVAIETSAFASGAGPVPGGIDSVMAALPPGAWLVSATNGDVPSLVQLALGAMAAALLTTRVGGDCYPELWDASRRRFAVREGTWRHALGEGGLRRLGGRTTGVSSSRGARLVPGGAGAVLWKEWVTLVRGPGGRVLLLVRLVGPVLAGAAVAALSRGTTSSSIAAVIGGLLVTQVMLFNMISSVRLAPELRTPMWWTVSSSLTGRLLAWTVASSLRQSVPLAIGVGTELLLSGFGWLAWPAVVVIVVACWGLRCMAVAMYSLLPARVDQRGPVGLLRGLAFAVLVVPVLALAVATGAATDSLLTATLTVVVLTGLEAWGMLRLASWRISGDALSIARMDEH